ncbi:hypothetical protein QWY31_07805 [Cytophagales bacterium LB-30]|uniref:Lipoprotein n=1 Tax=Shiella aurantiaca TaxID=3058365 RepID=A0ABT8F5A2_9BACT|nr:hypothetical protein [Shiella aurantiaca]MDN4165401.1 hypothetical protein [Shiella aurantiaca]
MKKLIGYILGGFFFISCTTTEVVNPAEYETFSRLYGNINNQYGVRVLEAEDGGFYILGYGSFINEDIPSQDILLIKTNKTGVVTEQWNYDFGGQEEARFFDWNQAQDGFVIVGMNEPGKLIVFEVDTNGEKRAEFTDISSDGHEPNHVHTSSSGYFITGSLNSNVFVYQLNANLELVQDFEFGSVSPLPNIVRSGIRTFELNGTLVSVFQVSTSNVSSISFNIPNLSTGLFDFQMELSSDLEPTVSCGTSQNQGLYLGGHTQDDIYLANTRPLQRTLQAEYQLSTTSIERIKSITLSADGSSLYVTGRRRNGNDQTILLIKLNASSGAIIWEKEFGGVQEVLANEVETKEVGVDVIATQDGGVALLSNTLFERNTMIGLVKLDANGEFKN